MSSDHVLSWRLYVDHDRAFGAKLQWLVSDYVATVISNALAVFLTLSARSVFIIVRRCIKTFVLPSEVRNTVDESHSPEGLFYRLCKHLFRGIMPGFVQLGENTRRCAFMIPSKQFLRDTWAAFKDRMVAAPGVALIASGMAILYIGMILISIFSALVVGDSIAISNHPSCAYPLLGDFWESPPAPFLFQGLKHYFDLETEIGNYFRDCYDGANADLCNYFYQPTIQMTTEQSSACRFKSEFEDLCDTNYPTGLSMSTARISPEIIGINTPFKYTFRRETTCSPLRTEPPFVQSVNINSTLYYRYNYGYQPGCTSEDLNCTYEIPVTWGVGSKAGYNVYAVRAAGYDPKLPTWQPSFTVNTTAGEVASLIIISNMGMLYPNKSTDPLFRAMQPALEWYFNDKLYAGVLGCIDRTDICTPNGSSCVGLDSLAHIINDVDEGQESRTIAYLVMSLYSSTMAESIWYRGETGLDAGSKHSAERSLFLDPEQWKVEVRQLFLTSLARIQITARNIARGYPNGVPDGFIDEMDRVPRLRSLCNMYKFRSTGWKNVNVSGLFGAVFGGVLVLFLSRTTENDEELRIEEHYRSLRRSTKLVALKTGWAAVLNQSKSCAEAIRPFLNRRLQLSNAYLNMVTLYGQSLTGFRSPRRQTERDHELR